MVTVEFLIKSMLKSHFQLKLNKYGRFLYLMKRNPVIFFSRTCLFTTEECSENFHVSSTKAVAFDELNWIEGIMDVDKKV